MEITMGSAQVARLLGVTVKTLQRWDREARLVPVARTESNRRLYTETQLRDFIGMKHPALVPTRLIAYCWVSSTAQRPDLRNQRRVWEAFVAARGLANVEFIEEIGSGLNFQRKRFLALMDDIGRHTVKTLVLAHPDRLTRFGFDWCAHYAAANGCELLVLNQEHLSPEQEMVQDMLAIAHCFSSRLYGLRSYNKVLKEALHADGAPDQA